MKTPFPILERAFRLARTAPLKELPDGAPSGFATRVLARLREDPSCDWTLWLLPRAIGAASLVAALTLVLAKQPEVDERELANLVMNAALEVQP